jgi:hypothetical protein
MTKTPTPKTRSEAKKSGEQGVDVPENNGITKQKVSKVSKNAGQDKPSRKTAEQKVSAEDSQNQGEKQDRRKTLPQLFKPGHSGNPGGKPVGTRNKLQGDFMRELAEDFSENGRAAIVACRTEKPDVYVKVIASLMPKEFEIKRPLEELSEDDLIAGVNALQSYLSGQTIPLQKNTH